jgi:S-adenosylmethionine hydrolase
MSRILTLTTDFGIADGYVGAMKGVVYDIAPNSQVVDITHLVPPQDIAAGAFAMYSACRFFPEGTVHVGVVDPGVDSERRGIVVETQRFVFVGPDNGLFSPFYETEQIWRIVAIENPDFKRSVVSATFHGRDVFAPVGAHLLQGVSCDVVGQEIDDPVKLDLWSVVENAYELVGRVVNIDHFGNAVTMMSRTRISEALGDGQVQIVVGENHFEKICHTYAEVETGHSLVLYGSLDTLEISVSGGSAAKVHGIVRGDEVRVQKV